MKRVITVLGLLLVFSNGYSQIRGGFENTTQWYVDDKKVKLDDKEAEKDRLHSNSYLKLDYDYKNWTIGTQIENYMPNALLNYNPEFKKTHFGSAYLRYNNVEKGIDVTAGHFYDQFGSGLLFRAWEDRQIGINNSVFGLNAKYNFNENIKGTVLGGKQRIGMGFDFAKSWIMGANFSFDIANMLKKEDFDLTGEIGYVGRLEDELEYNSDLDKLTNAFSIKTDFAKGGFYVGAEYVYKQNDVLVEMDRIYPNISHYGSALLINTGYSKKGMAFNINLRRMENMAFYSQRDFSGNFYLKGTMNYIPALTKQYDYSLQNIYVYQAQPFFDMNMRRKVGEIGGQFDFYYEFAKGSTLGGEYGTNLVVNGSYWAGIKNEVNGDKTGLKSEFLGFGNKYYSDFGVEVRKKWSKDWSSIFMYLNQYYNSPFLDGKEYVIKSNILSAETTYQFLEDKSVRLEAQHMWANGDKKNWVAGTAEFAYNNNWSMYVSDMYNYGNDDTEKRIHYYNVGASYTKGVTRVSAGYGRQRGGLLCVGGICRMVSEAAGLTIGITTSF